MEMKSGYKKTEIGVIPEEWIEHTIGELIEFEGGSQPDKSYFRTSGKLGYVRLIQIRDYKTDKYETYVPTHLARRFCTEHDIMIGRYGPPVFQILRGISGAYNVALIKAKPRSSINGTFAYYVLKQDKLFSFIEKLSQRSSGQTGVDLKELRQYPIPLPPTKAEQEAIAEALSDVDALIESLEQIIGKKRHIKQGVMQELLRPKQGWLSKQLGSLATLINGRAYSINEWETMGTPVIRLQNLTGRGETYYYSNLDLPEKQYCHSGDLLFMWSATFGPIIWQGPKAIFHYHIWKIECQPKQLSNCYLYHLLSEITEKLKCSSSSGGTMLHLTKSGMEKMEISVPDYDEQERVATILSDIDAEITALETKLVKTRQIKQAMMHNLLTGRIRLI